MFRTKEQVDLHVQTLFKRCRNETERSLRCYHLSKLYKQVGDFESARRFIIRYMSSREGSAEAHRLYGQILIGLKQKSKALTEFKSSLELDHHQHDLLPKVCDLLAEMDEPLDPDVAQYWMDRTRTHFPNHPTVFRLRERVMMEKRNKNDASLPKDVDALEALLKAELEVRPTDVSIRVRLLQLYLRENRIKDAYHHAVVTESSRLHSNDLRWYDCVADVFEAYKENTSDWDYVAGKINVLERLCALSLEEYSTVDCPVTRSNADCAKCIRSFDQALHSASLLDVVSSEREFFHEFLKHMRGQLVLHLATLLFRKVKKDTVAWREVSKAAAALLMHAVGFGGNSPPDPQPPWVMRLPEARRTEVARWAVETSFRVSQAGHILMGLQRDRGSHFLDQIGNFCTGNWRERVYQRALGTQYDKQMDATSHFLNFQQFAQPVLEMPSKSDLQPYDNMAQKQNPGSLHHLVWLGLESGYCAVEGSARPFQIPPEFCCLAFDGLSLNSSSLRTGAPDSVSQLDADSFLYATIYCSAALKEEWDSKLSLPAGQELPTCLPVALTEPLCSPNQTRWWLTVHQLLTGYPLFKGDNKSSSVTDVGGHWSVLQRGLQVIRAQGNHGLGPELAVKLARTFSKRGKMLSSSPAASSNEVHALEERANIYWAAALPLLERLSRNQAIQFPQSRMFDYQCKPPLSNSDVTVLLDEAHLAMALKMMLDGKDEAAISAFQQLKVPEASFNQALIYKKLASQEVNGHHREDITPEMRSRQVALLTKAKECLHLTEERLRMNGVDKSHPTSMGVSNELEDLDSQMDRLNISSWREDEKSTSLSRAKEDLLGEMRDSRGWSQERNWWLIGSRNGNPVEPTSTPIRRGTPSRLPSNLTPSNFTRTLPPETERHNERNHSPVHLDQNLRMTLDRLPKFIEECSMLILSVTEGMGEMKSNQEDMKSGLEDVKSGLEDLKGMVRGEIDEINKKMAEMKDQLNSVKDNISKFKTSRHQHHATTDATRQTVEGRDAEEDIYVYGDEDEYGEGEEVTIAAAAANAAAAAAAAAAAVAAQTQSDKYSAYPGAGYPYQGYPSYRPIGAVQGATPVAYGAPAAATQAPPPQALLPPSIAPFFPLAGASVDPSLLPTNAAGIYHSSLRYYSQGALPFSEGQQLPDFRGDAHALSGVPLRPPLLPSAIPTHPDSDRGTPQFRSIGSDGAYIMDGRITGPPPPLPVNVISASLPTSTPPTQQPLGAAIPPKQRLGTPATPSQPVSTSVSTPITSTTTTAPHAFQISMPPQAQIPNAPPLDKSSPSVPPLETDKLLSSVPSPLHSAVAIDKSTPKSARSKGLDATSSKTRSFRASIGEESEEGGEEGDSIDHDPYPDFQPSIPLPALVETHTGEEEEKLLFSSRAKLYRFVDKEWKERGVGILKILHNEDTGKVRIIMRREQVFKVCANHFITPDMALSPIASSKGLAWLWCANDFADEEVRLEKLSARFKTIVDAEAFREAFEKATRIASQGTPDKSSSKGVKEAPEKVNAALPPSAEAHKVITSTPESSKSGTTGTTEGSKVVIGGFTFVSPPTLKPVDNDENKSASKKKNEEKNSAKPSIFADFTFGQSTTPTKWGQSSLQIASTLTTKTSEVPSSETKTVPPEATPKKDNTVFDASRSSPVSFASLAADNKDKDLSFKSDSNTKGFEGAGKVVFGSSPPSGGRRISESEEGDFMPTVEFKPVIPLPQLVEVKTGEEGEDVLFERRAKLLRYGNKEWIEFGIGQMKITYNSKTGKVRLIMRREQVLKVCCNHFLTEDLQFISLKTSDRCWTWHALDYSDGQYAAKTLAVKFKTAEEASEFKQVLDSLQKNMVDGKVQLDDEFLASKLKPNKKSEESSDQGCSVSKEASTGIFKTEGTPAESKAEKDGVTGVASPVLQVPSYPASATKSDSTLSAGGFTFWSNKQPFSDNQKSLIFGQESGTPNSSSIDTQKQPLFGVGSVTPKAKSDMSLKTEGVSGAVVVSTPSVTQPPATQSTFKFGTTSAKPAEGSLAAFKPEEGSWECGSCYVRNKKDIVTCCACGDQKPGTVATSNTVAPSPQTAFRFGMPDVAANMKAMGLTDVSATTTFTFGSTSVVSTTAKPSEDMWASNKIFGDWSSGTTASFSNPSFNAETPFKFTFGKQPAEASSQEFTFDSNQKYEFHFKGVDPIPSKSPSAKGSALKSPDRQLSHDESGGSDLYQEEDDGDHIHFQPVIPLPDKVPLHTGEEDEQILYQHRAKLYRWCAGEWKERGCGDIKLLKHQETGRVRMLMRREQVLKLCLNHYVTDEVKLTPKGDRAWQWTAVDFSEGEMQPEMFSLKFKSSDIAQSFKEAFESAKCGGNQISPAEGGATPKTTTEATTPSVTSPATSAFSLSKSPAMTTFRFQLDSDVGSKPEEKTPPCFSLEGLFGGKSPSAESPRSNQSPEIEVIYEATPSEEERQAALRLMLPANFFNYRNKPPCPGCRGCEDEDGVPRRRTAKPEEASQAVTAKLSENVVTSVADSTTKSTTEDGKDGDANGTKAEEGDFGIPFFKVDPNLSFATLAAKPTSTFASVTSSPPSWGNVKTQVFGSQQSKDNKKTAGGDSDGEEEEGGTVETHDPHFEPIIPLPALVQVRTGEEDEVKVFCERAKLYRFDADTKEWKERGVGELKILFHPKNYTYRFLMRRDQVYKLVLNHLITAEFELKEMTTSDRSYLWYASNYIDEKQSLEKLCARFKKMELAREFAEVVQRCVADLASHQSTHHQKLSEASSEQPEEEEDDYHVEDEYDDDYEYEVVDEDSLTKKIMFEKRGKIHERDLNEWKSIGAGEIKVIYDPEINGALLTFVTDGEAGEINTLIVKESTVEAKDKYCVCTSADPMKETALRRFKIQFSSEYAVADFESSFKRVLCMLVEPQEESDDGD
ncbi:E3 SUMO-protein ligase RanBP2 isoform X2 [Hetaerina americana]|uniref:E3 SUMO-protein ligase RanBP2 isoform X2 n=1 Tax=Hetaerina americana TaxID=62018 RepID=UPI003A7F39C1